MSHLYPSQLALRIDWSEMDLFGHVNNVAFYKYIQASRVHYWEMTGVLSRYETENIGPILASGSCQFRKPLHYPGTLTVQTRAEFIGTTSFGLAHRILDEQGETAAEGNDVIVMYDFGKGKKIPVSEAIRAAIEALEGRSF